VTRAGIAEQVVIGGADLGEESGADFVQERSPRFRALVRVGGLGGGSWCCAWPAAGLTGQGAGVR
jgi:hypothetical protein